MCSCVSHCLNNIFPGTNVYVFMFGSIISERERWGCYPSELFSLEVLIAKSHLHAQIAEHRKCIHNELMSWYVQHVQIDTDKPFCVLIHV